MAKKYVFSSIMIVSAILAIISLVFPYYRIDFNGIYGSTTVNGSISVSGLAFIFGLNSTNTGDFLTKTFTTIPQVIVLIIAILSFILLILSIVSLVNKNKDSVLFLSLNLTTGAVSIINMFLSIFFIKIAYISIASKVYSEITNPEKISLNETLGYGAILGIVFLCLLGIFSLVLAFVSFYDYRMSLKEDNGEHKFYYGPTLGDYSKNKLPYENKKQIEQKYSNKLLGLFTKKEDKKEEVEEIDYSSNNEEEIKTEEKKEPSKNKPSSPYERDFSKINPSSNDKPKNPHGIKTRTGVFDINYKEEISATKTTPSSSEKTLDERIADLDKLYKDHMISKEDYDKYKEALIKKYGK